MEHINQELKVNTEKLFVMVQARQHTGGKLLIKMEQSLFMEKVSSPDLRASKIMTTKYFNGT